MTLTKCYISREILQVGLVLVIGFHENLDFDKVILLSRFCQDMQIERKNIYPRNLFPFKTL